MGPSSVIPSLRQLRNPKVAGFKSGPSNQKTVGPAGSLVNGRAYELHSFSPSTVPISCPCARGSCAWFSTSTARVRSSWPAVSKWKHALAIVEPTTVVPWQREGFPKGGWPPRRGPSPGPSAPAGSADRTTAASTNSGSSARAGGAARRSRRRAWRPAPSACGRAPLRFRQPARVRAGA